MTLAEGGGPGLPGGWRPYAVPAAIVLVTALLLAFGPRLPHSLAGLRTYGPYAVLALGAAVALWFNRGRAAVALVSLLIAYIGFRYALGYGAHRFPARAAYVAMTVFVPLNVLAALVLPERGVVHHGDYRWLLLFAAEVLLTAWIAASGRSELSGTTWQRVFEHWLLRSPPLPWLARFVFGAALAAALVRAWQRPAPLETGMVTALAAYFVACAWGTTRGVAGTLNMAAGVALIFAILQESHRMAFGDELTGLPSRRMLEERLRGLGPVYAIAMVDVDHFKKFNDRHGHQTGDQVLKLVAARLAETGGGARAYRYGGEEFTLLFPDLALDEALPHLERTRESIEQYRMALRGADRPADGEEAARRRGAGRGAEALSVTVSIGAAGPDAARATPAEVVAAADQALYRAKQEGRNCVRS